MSKNKQGSETVRGSEPDLTKCRVPAVVCPYHRQGAGKQLSQPGGLSRALSGSVYTTPSLHRAAIYQRNNKHIVEGIFSNLQVN